MPPPPLPALLLEPEPTEAAVLSFLDDAHPRVRGRILASFKSRKPLSSVTIRYTYCGAPVPLFIDANRLVAGTIEGHTITTDLTCDYMSKAMSDLDRGILVLEDPPSFEIDELDMNSDELERLVVCSVSFSSL
jgi:hypothetical protein